MELLVPFLKTSLACVGVLKTCEILKDKNIVSVEISRKIIHIMIGVVFTLSWQFYPQNNYYSRFVVGIIPSLFAIQFTLIGTGIIENKKAVLSMSRSGNPKELLRGPCAYGYSFTLLTIIYWLDSPIGLITILILSFGDGFSALTGILFGRRVLPYNKQKTYIGTTCFFLSSFIFTFIFLNIMSDYFTMPVITMIPSLFITCFICAIVESLPILSDWDNVTISISSVILLKLFGY